MEKRMQTKKVMIDNNEVLVTLATHKKRVWEVDVLRGILILFVVFDHVMYNFASEFTFNTEFGLLIKNFAMFYRSSPLRLSIHKYFLISFVVLSGVSVAFSKNNFARGLKMAFFALALTVIMRLFGDINNKSCDILFNILHVVAVSILVWSLCKFIKMPNWVILLLGIVIIAIGNRYLYKPAELTSEFWFFLVNSNFNSLSPADYLPLLPYLGWFLIGGIVGQKVYQKKETIFPLFNDRKVSMLTWCGKHSLAIYFLSQLVAYSLMFLLTYAKIL